LRSQHFSSNEELMEGVKTAELTGGRLLWCRHTKTYSPIWQVPQFLLWLHWEVAWVCTYFLYIIKYFVLIACFVNSSPELLSEYPFYFMPSLHKVNKTSIMQKLYLFNP
jgi:hypothetical protein